MRTRPVVLALRIAVLSGLSMLQLGSSCGARAPKYVGPPVAQVFFDVPYYAGLHVNDSVPVHVYALVQGAQLQALELSVAATGGLLRLHSAQPGSEFDDDGNLFVQPTYSPGQDAITNIVDLRHGASPVFGSVRIATFWVDALATGDASLEITEAKLASREGEEIAVTTQGHSLFIAP